jgi:hypothetical protein
MISEVVAIAYKPWNSEAIFSADLKPANVDINSNILLFEYMWSSKKIARLSGWVWLLRALPSVWTLHKWANAKPQALYSITNSGITGHLHSDYSVLGGLCDIAQVIINHRIKDKTLTGQQLHNGQIYLSGKSNSEWEIGGGFNRRI